jgi:hypothetical protein
MINPANFKAMFYARINPIKVFNIRLDYTLFGFDKAVEPDSEFINL